MLTPPRALVAGEPLAAVTAFASVSTGRKAPDVVIGGRQRDSLDGQYVQFMHQLAFVFMEAKPVAVAGRKPRKPVGQRVKVCGDGHAAALDCGLRLSTTLAKVFASNEQPQEPM
jgi:hypothetical protein